MANETPVCGATSFANGRLSVLDALFHVPDAPKTPEVPPTERVTVEAGSFAVNEGRCTFNMSFLVNPDDAVKETWIPPPMSSSPAPHRVLLELAARAIVI